MIKSLESQYLCHDSRSGAGSLRQGPQEEHTDFVHMHAITCLGENSYPLAGAMHVERADHSSIIDSGSQGVPLGQQRSCWSKPASLPLTPAKPCPHDVEQGVTIGHLTVLAFSITSSRILVQAVRAEGIQHEIALMVLALIAALDFSVCI